MYGFNSPTQMKYPSPNAPSSMSMPQSSSGRGNMSHLRRSPNPGNTSWQAQAGFSQNQVLWLFLLKNLKTNGIFCLQLYCILGNLPYCIVLSLFVHLVFTNLN